METNEIQTIVKRFILEELAPDCDPVDLKEEQSLLGTGIIDSFGIMSLLTFLEEKFKLTVPADELIPGNFETISAIVKLISGRLQRNN